MLRILSAECSQIVIAIRGDCDSLIVSSPLAFASDPQDPCQSPPAVSCRICNVHICGKSPCMNVVMHHLTVMRDSHHLDSINLFKQLLRAP